jgi:broad specificity phosphatase PhoE
VKVVLVRHGRSSHIAPKLMDLDAFLQWRDAYDEAGIDDADSPPRELLDAAQHAGLLVSSDTRRAIESARVLARGREVIASPLLREIAIEPPTLPRIRLPLIAWALGYGVRWLFREALGRAHGTAEEEARVRAAARWLTELATQHGEVLVLTHASFRSRLAKELARQGWVATTPRRSSHHWSAWSFKPPLSSRA